MNRYTRWGLALALLPIAACSTTPPPAPPMLPAPPPPLAATDASFIQTAAQGGMAEVQMAQVADQNSMRRPVKAYADQMIKDHTAANDQLKQIATAKGATVPASVSDEQQKMLTMLQGEKGRKFDHDYITAQIADHKQMLMLFQTEAASGTDPDLKNFAAQTAPTIQQHLTEAQKLSAMGHHRMMRHHKKVVS